MAPVKHSPCWSAGLAIPLLLGAVPSFAQDDEPLDRTPADCVVISNIDRTKVLDEQTILFYMRNNRIYRNYMPRKCPNLVNEDRFMYETRSSRLCSIDMITVLEQWGGRLQPGFTCRLGEFHPVSKEEAEELERDLREGRGRDPVDSKPVDVPADDDSEGAPPAPAGGAAEE